MPLEIAVADGRLADWTRFDVRGNSVVKDRSVLLATGDTQDNALELLASCWTKLGRTGLPPNGNYFTRDDFALNKQGLLPLTPTPPTLASRTTTSIVVNIADPRTYANGSAVVSVTVRAVPTLGGTTVSSITLIKYPYPSTATVSGLVSATQYAVSYRFTNDFGAGAYSTTTNITTN